MSVSRYEANLWFQPALLRAALAAPAPAWLKRPDGRKCFLVGVGSNHHAARIAAWEWSRAGLDARAVHAHDFVSRPYRLGRGDLGVFLSHRGGRTSYTVRAERLARRGGAETVAVCGQGAAWPGPSRRLETCELEDTNAFTKSVTTTLAWLLRWAGAPRLLAPFRRVDASLRWGPRFPEAGPQDDLVLIGDGPREWVATETALKIQETSYLRARSFGLEEFLHGPLVSVGKGSTVVGFTSPREKRWSAARRFLAAVGVPFTEAASEDWLAQTLWGQRFALELCRRRGLDPDALRADDPRYARVKRSLGL